ncbi:TPA: ABC transporter transmembrane domain-containing protein [Klebsiella variicola subsp. variicola]
MTVKFQAQQFFNFTHPRSQSCHGDTPPEDALSGRSVVHCFKSEKRGIPTEGQIWPEQIGIRGRIKLESAIGLNRNQWSVWVGIRIRVFHHLIHLPLAWFDARSKGSINARFEAIHAIQQALTTQVLEGLLDVLLAVTTLCMMLLYSPERR